MASVTSVSGFKGQLDGFGVTGIYTGWRKKRPEICLTNGAYTSWGEISFGTFVDQYVLLLTYKFQ